MGIGVFFADSPLYSASFDRVVSEAIKTWTQVDTASAIAQADHNYFDSTIAYAHLDLYAALYTFSQSNDQYLISEHEMLQIRVLLYAIARSNFNLFSASMSDESACVRVVMKKMMNMWDDMSNKHNNGSCQLRSIEV